jgi:ribosomal protein S12 methylthiotransferase
LAVRVGMISLGCMKNLVDSEVMLGLLREKGYGITPHENNADILIINTCAFIDAAKQESLDTILQVVSSNGEHQRKIIVAGCLAQRYSRQLEEELGGEIHALLGTGDLHYITDACEAVLAGEGFFKQVSETPSYLYDHNTPRLRTTRPHYAYVKIAEGCDNRCSYCVIPQLRGRYRSRSVESIVAEVSYLVKDGVKEVNLIAQDTTCYGQDLWGRTSLRLQHSPGILGDGRPLVRDGADLPSLLRRLIRIPDMQWIRILYGHPAHISDELLTLIASEEKICSYIDVPVQHIHDEILRKMGRRTSQSQIQALIAKIRNTIPDVTLRTSLIVGFPGETEQHFNRLMKFVKQVEFDHLGVFAYSVEEGTKAADMPDHVPESVKKERMDRIARLHEQIAMKGRKRLIGQQKIALVDSGGDQAIGRTQGQAPEIDDIVYITGDDVKSGEFVKLEITDTCGPYDLIGRVIL